MTKEQSFLLADAVLAHLAESESSDVAAYAASISMDGE